MSQTTSTNTCPLTVVLVHGAFADASSWTAVIERLQAAGVQVTRDLRRDARRSKQ
jgi:hypothetical protein